MKTISLRKFRDSIVDIGEEIQVARRDSDGNIMVIGRWIPSLVYPSDAAPLPGAELETAYPYEPGSLRVELPKDITAVETDPATGRFNTQPFKGPIPKVKPRG